MCHGLQSSLCRKPDDMEGTMQIETPLHAEHQLDQLAAQFEHWRQTRRHPGERFPQALWDQAVALAATLPPAHVAKQLRLRLIDLIKQMAAPPTAPSLPLGFVEVPSAPARPAVRASPHTWVMCCPRPQRAVRRVAVACSALCS